MPEPSCLNEYHLEFLKLLVDRGCRFLIVGGQARAIHFGTPTRDLDVWLDLSAGNKIIAEQCISAWIGKYRAHAGYFQQPISLRPGLFQFHFPDVYAAYLGADGEMKPIATEDGIDVLTGIGSANFAEHFERAHWQVACGLRLPFIASTDLDFISPPKHP